MAESIAIRAVPAVAPPSTGGRLGLSDTVVARGAHKD